MRDTGYLMGGTGELTEYVNVASDKWLLHGNHRPSVVKDRDRWRVSCSRCGLNLFFRSHSFALDTATSHARIRNADVS